MFAKSFYVDLQSTRLLKIIWAVWSDIQQTELEKLRRRQEDNVDIRLAGDGRFDSRGRFFITTNRHKRRDCCVSCFFFIATLLVFYST